MLDLLGPAETQYCDSLQVADFDCGSDVGPAVVVQHSAFTDWDMVELEFGRTGFIASIPRGDGTDSNPVQWQYTMPPISCSVVPAGQYTVTVRLVDSDTGESSTTCSDQVVVGD